MATFLTVLHSATTLATATLLLLVIAMHPPRTTLSRFELKRRADVGDKAAIKALYRESLIGDIVSLRRVMISVLTVALTLLSVTLFGWIIGTLVVIIIALEEYGLIYRLHWLYRLAQKLYDQIEPWLLQMVEKYSAVFWLIRARREAKYDDRIESREHLLHMLDKSGDILSDDEKRMIKEGLSLNKQRVGTIMTPVADIAYTKRSELLGPLVLDDLHKTGHSRFPVIDKDIHHIIGTLDIRDLLTVGSGKRSITVEKSMEPRVFYIREDQTVAHALAAFLRIHNHIFIVVNKESKTVGLISLEDVIEAMLGRRIVDEFDEHEDLSVVAARRLRDSS